MYYLLIVSSPSLEPIKEEDKLRPVANVLEGAKRTGRATGIVATSEIQHATPAGFSAHHVNRKQFDVIAKQQVYQNIDVVLGGKKQRCYLCKVMESQKMVKI